MSLIADKYTQSEVEEFARLIDENRYNLVKLIYLIFPFGEPGTDLEHEAPYDWQVEEWIALSKHIANPLTRDIPYKLAVSTGNGAAKTSWGAMTTIALMYTQRVRGRIMANTLPQMNSVVWPEYDTWYNRARFVDIFFDKLGTSIKALDEKKSETWRLDAVTWNENNPSAVSGLHNKGGVVLYTLEEAPGIPAVIFKYISGAFTETNTIKLMFAFGNSDDPNSYFEQIMRGEIPGWRIRRIDTRTLPHISKEQIRLWLLEAGGDEDNDDFRVRVRGLPRKTAQDSIMSTELVAAALERGYTFEGSSQGFLPVVLMCDPAWTGGDETVIWYRQGMYCCLLERFKLDKTAGETHQFTFARLCTYERELGADAVFIDQAEGTGIYTLAVNAGKAWELVSFAGKPNDTADSRDSDYANMRAQMHYLAKKFLQDGGMLAARKKEDEAEIQKQLTWAKGSRHKTTTKKTVESKDEIKKRVGQSPDVCDGFVLGFYREVVDRLPENASGEYGGSDIDIGGSIHRMPEYRDPYSNEVMDADFQRLYNR